MKTWTRYAFCSLLLLLLDVGCGTVAPKVEHPTQATLDVVPDPRGNLQNSGALYFTNLVVAGVTNRCLVITEAAHARFTNLAARFGDRFVPPLTATGGVWLVRSNFIPLWAVQKARVADWARMNQWAMNPQMEQADDATWSWRSLGWWAFGALALVALLILRRKKRLTSASRSV